VTSQALKYDVTTYIPCEGLNQWFSKWPESSPRGRFWGARENKGDDRGENKTKGAKTLNRYQ